MNYSIKNTVQNVMGDCQGFDTRFAPLTGQFEFISNAHQITAGEL